MANQAGLLSTSAAFLILTLTACAPIAPRDEASRRETIPAAEEVAAQGNSQGAAKIYLDAAAQAQPKQRNSLLLQALVYLVRASDFEQAASVFQQIDTHNFNMDLMTDYRLLGAALRVHEQDWSQALGLLSFQLSVTAPRDRATLYYRLRARAWEGAGQPLESARARIHLDPLLTQPERAQNQRRLLEALISLERSTLNAALGYAEPELSEWIHLGLILEHFPLNAPSLEKELSEWRQDYPGAAVLPSVLDQIVASLRKTYRAPERIGLLLPSSGPFTEAAAAVRDGFLAAYYAASEASRPEIRMYDSGEQGEVWNGYHRAVADDVDAIVGPLDKAAVKPLTQANGLEVPILALNRVAVPTSSEGLYQFGLLPEEEAEQSATRAWQDGYRRALILVPEGQWGARIARAFRKHWEQMGGIVSGEQTYPSEATDFDETVRNLLNLDESRARPQQLTRVIDQQLNYDPRSRADADMIFLGAFPRQARMLLPQLRFYRADTLPVYATSHVFAGRENSTEDQDMNGLRFCDMPWLLNAASSYELSPEKLASLWPTRPVSFLRLYAMGMDAYTLVNQLHQLGASTEQSLAGRSGQLRVDEQGHVHRELVWGQFTNGVPQPLGAWNGQPMRAGPNLLPEITEREESKRGDSWDRKSIQQTAPRAPKGYNRWEPWDGETSHTP